MAAPNFANRTLYHGNNLPVLRGINSESVHLIAMDRRSLDRRPQSVYAHDGDEQ